MARLKTRHIFRYTEDEVPELMQMNQGDSAAKSLINKNRRISFLDKCAMCLLACCPIIQHYKGPFINAAVSVLLLLFPYVVIKLIRKNVFSARDLRIVLPLIVFFLFQVVDHGTSVTETGQAVVFIIYIIAIAGGCFETSYFLRVITAVSLLACLCIIVQYFCYYILKFHLQLVPTTLLLPRCKQWELLAKTGRYSITGKLIKFYRPSAFFLEPSHMFIYMFTPTIIRFFSARDKKTKRASWLLLVGMVLTTSGMAILTVAMLFFLSLGKASAGEMKKFSILRILRGRKLIKLGAFLILVVFALVFVPFFRNSVERVFGSGTDYSNAIAGRLASGIDQIKQLSGIHILFGVQDGLKGVTASMSGFNETLFQYGLIGLVLSYIFYVRGLFVFKNEYFWVAFVVLAVSLFSQHTHSTMFLLYQTFVYVNGYKTQSDKSISTGIFRKTTQVDGAQVLQNV